MLKLSKWEITKLTENFSFEIVNQKQILTALWRNSIECMVILADNFKNISVVNVEDY